MIAPPNPSPEDKQREITANEVFWLTSVWMTVALRTKKEDHNLALELFRFMSAYALDPEAQRERLAKLPPYFRQVAREMDVERRRIASADDPAKASPDNAPAVELTQPVAPPLSPENTERLTHLVAYMADLLVNLTPVWQAALPRIAEVAANLALHSAAYADCDWSQSHPIYRLVVAHMQRALRRREQELVNEAKENLNGDPNKDVSG